MNRTVYRLIIGVLTMMLVSTLLLSQHQVSQAGQPGRANRASASAQQGEFLRVVDSTTESLVLEFTPPQFNIEASSISGQDCKVVNISGLLLHEVSGQPAVPVQGAMVGIPAEGQPTIEILSLEEHVMDGFFDLCPAQTMRNSRPLGSQLPQLSITHERGPAYQENQFQPAQSVELVSTGNLRSQRYAQLRFSPVQYNPVSGQVRFTSRVVVKMSFNASQLAHSDGSFISESEFEDSLKGMLVNYEQAKAWRSLPQKINPTLVVAQSLAAQPQYKIMVNQDGIYEVTPADLLAAGVTQDELDTLDPATLQLFLMSNEVAIQVEGQQDGVFDSTDVIRFYGQKANTKYTDTAVYWLTWGAATGLRMVSQNGAVSGTASVPADFLTTHHAEIDTDYYGDMPSGANKDHWYWMFVDAFSAPGSTTVKTTLQHISTISHTISVRGLLKGYTSIPNHHTRIYLNGHLIDDHSFPTGAEYQFSVDVPQSYLVEGENSLTVECPRDGLITLDSVLTNWFEIDYYDTTFAESDALVFDSDQPGTWEQRVDGFTTSDIELYDVTTPLLPRVITGGAISPTANGYQLAFEATITDEHRYLAQTAGQRKSPLEIVLDSPSSWKTTTIGADYIIITHANFLTQVQPLAAYRASQNYRVQVVDVQDLYDEFNGGIFSPEAIKSFLAYAYANWIQPAPKYVLLVGDGHFDFKNILGYGEPIYIPPYLDDVDPWMSETATDNRYVSVSGADILPDLYIGRFPARDAAEAQTMVEKTINYEQTPEPGDWTRRQTFVADNPDDGGDFYLASDQIILKYVSHYIYTVDKIYLLKNFSTATAARTALIAAINQGRLVVHYAGHASVQQWANENLLSATALSALTNGNKLPFFIPMTCLEGYFIWPSGFPVLSMAETAVRINGRGAVASWSATGYGLTNGHYYLDESLFGNMFHKFKSQLGYLTTTAKYDLYARTSSYNDLIETYTLFGDPALKLNLTSLKQYLPSVQK